MTGTDSDYIPSDHSDSESPDLKSLTDIVKIDSEQWKKIEPHQVFSKGQEYIRLKDGWTRVFKDAIWSQLKLPCAWAFQNHHIRKKKGSSYLHFSGKCTGIWAKTGSHCPASISGIIKEKPEPECEVEIQISAFDTTEIPHIGQRHFAGEERAEGKKILKLQSAKQFQQERANDNMDDSDLMPPHLYSLDVLRKVRQEARDENIGIDKYPGTPLVSLHKILKDHPEMRVFSTLPFTIMYWTEQQSKLYRSGIDINPSISIDATGSLIQKVDIFNRNFTSHLFPYTVVIGIDSKIFPLSQMVSDVHDTTIICEWLTKWLTCPELEGIRPKEIIMDCSLALLNSTSLALFDYSYNDYLSACFDFLQHRGEKPDCLIKRDRNHLIKNVRNWKCFDKEDWSVKDFYTRLIGYSLEIGNLSDLREVLEAILCLSDSMEGECRNAYEKLLLAIETFERDIFKITSSEKKLDEEESSEKEESDKNINLSIIEIELLEDKPKDIFEFICDIKNTSLIKSCAKIDIIFPESNAFKCPSLVEYLINLYSQFPAWTDVMNEFYDIPTRGASSCRSETHFKILKNEYNFQKPISVNRFVLAHINCISGEVKIGRALIKQIKTCSIPFLKESESAINQKIHVHEESYINKEGRLNQAKPIQFGRAQNCVKTRPQLQEKQNIIFQLNHPHLLQDVRNEKTEILKNASKLVPVLVAEEYVQFRNSCAFDTISEILTSAYCNYITFKTYIDKLQDSTINSEDETDFLKFLTSYGSKGVSCEFSKEQIYQARTTILLKLTPPEDNVVNSEANAATLFEKLMNPFLGTYKKIDCINSDCKGYTEAASIIPIPDPLTLWNKGFSKLETVMNSYLQGPHVVFCKQCDAVSATLQIFLDNYLCIDVEYLYIDGVLARQHKITPRKTKINEIPVVLKLRGETFFLCGVAEYQGDTNRKYLGHYIAYVLCNNLWLKKDDLRGYSELVDPQTLPSMAIHLIFYVKV